MRAQPQCTTRGSSGARPPATRRGQHPPVASRRPAPTTVRRRVGTTALLLLAAAASSAAQESPADPHGAGHHGAPEGAEAPRELTPAERAEAEAAFHTMMEALTSPRCVNCHPNDGVPKQTDAARAHLFGVAGSDDLHGYDALRCNACHQASNDGWSGVPGAPGWSLAPASMAWEGLDRRAIARSMMGPAMNGGRSADDILHHLTAHELVLWAWEPGVAGEGRPRTPPPVPLETYRAAVRTWIAAGAPIPEARAADAPGADAPDSPAEPSGDAP